MGELAAELVELFEPVAHAQGLTLSLPSDAAGVVQGNRQLLAQLLTNLIENGLKYVPAGGRIEVDVRRVADSVQLLVSDNGPGIAAAERARAVQPFVRIGAGIAHEGSGLGLSLVAAIARLHRGRLELKSNEPGLKVLVELPA
jgi:signal transduction histidine kinase